MRITHLSGSNLHAYLHRKAYKRASYASHNILLDRSVLEDVLSDLKSHTLQLEKALQRVRKTVKRADGARHRGRRSRHRARSRSRYYRGPDTAYGAEDVAATVAWELATVVIRGGTGALGGDIDIDDIDLGGGSDGDDFKTDGRF